MHYFQSTIVMFSEFFSSFSVPITVRAASCRPRRSAGVAGRAVDRAVTPGCPGRRACGGGGGAGGAKSSKLQVKLLKYVEGTGSVSASGATGNIRSDRVTPARVYQCHSCVEKSYLGLDAKTSYVRHHIDHFSRPPRSSWILSTMLPYFRSETSSLWPRPFITTN